MAASPQFLVDGDTRFNSSCLICSSWYFQCPALPCQPPDAALEDMDSLLIIRYISALHASYTSTFIYIKIFINQYDCQSETNIYPTCLGSTYIKRFIYCCQIDGIHHKDGLLFHLCWAISPWFFLLFLLWNWILYCKLFVMNQFCTGLTPAKSKSSVILLYWLPL